jgi:hypothetical protein
VVISARRLLIALAAAILLAGPYTYVVYDGGLAQSGLAVAGSLLLLGLALAVAWASHRRPE